MTSAMTSCADWLNSTPAETKVERFGLSLWSQRKTNPKSEMTHYMAIVIIQDEYNNRQANPRKYDSKNFWWHFLFKAGNWARKYHYGPGFQKHPVAKMRFDLEGQIWGSKVKWGQIFKKKYFVLSFYITSSLAWTIEYLMSYKGFNV